MDHVTDVDVTEGSGAVELVEGDSIELSFTPLLRWRDALMRVLGLAMPSQMVSEVSVQSIVIKGGHPAVRLHCDMRKINEARVVDKAHYYPQDRCPHGADWNECPVEKQDDIMWV